MAMAATSQSQHRCVFVGNIPYDATEEQLIQICEEVGPVVSFRLVIDRETGKPKGYGFCEYKDEETALSARRNLQGYQINGRQLRVDFAENDKNADKNIREQGRGGPGIVPSIDPQKQFGGTTVIQDPGGHQPVGGSVAMAAATVMAGALGAAQTSGTSSQAGFQSLLGTDVLTRHLAKMSRGQLTEIMSELKAMASENKEQAQQILLAFPNLPKALFQAQIMLGMVSQQMLQKPNIQQATAQLVQSGQTPPGLPPLPQNKFGVLPYVHETQASTGLSNQYGAVTKFHTQSVIQRPQLVQNQVLQQGQQSGASSLASMGAHSLAGSHGPHIQISTSSYLNQQLRPPLSHHGDQAPPTNLPYNGQLVAQSASRQTSAHPLYMTEAFQPSSSTSSALPANVDLKRHDLNLQGKREMVNDISDHMYRAPKMVKLNNGIATPYLQANLATPVSTTPSVTTELLRKQTSIAEKTPEPVKQVSQMQLPADMDSTLLQQVLNLTQEQLSCLPPDQQQQVIQLQQMLQQAT